MYLNIISFEIINTNNNFLSNLLLIKLLISHKILLLGSQFYYCF